MSNREIVEMLLDAALQRRFEIAKDHRMTQPKYGYEMEFAQVQDTIRFLEELKDRPEI